MTPETFRQQYPNGGLVSELTAVKHGQFIVRVMLNNDEGKAMCSALAAAPTVEQAEDNARTRAFHLLAAMGHAPRIATPMGHAAISGGSLPSPTPKLKPQPVPAPSPMAPVVSPTPVSAPMPAPTLSPVNTINSLPLDLPLSEPPEPELIMEPPLSTPPVPEPVAMSPEEPLDFSDIIARTDVELKRLNWGSDQGRNYLLETYGKRSRQLLSDEELLEFLRFLETQPSP